MMKSGKSRGKLGFSKSFDKGARRPFGRDDRGSRGPGRFDDKPRGRGRDFDRSDVPRTMHEITCSECGAEDRVPFRPSSGKPVLCGRCFGKEDRRESSRGFGRGGDERPRGRSGFGRPDFARPERSERSARPARAERSERSDGNAKQLAEINEKLDRILAMFEGGMIEVEEDLLELDEGSPTEEGDATENDATEDEAIEEEETL